MFLEENKPASLEVFTPTNGESPLAILHFVHGMCEHKNRYKDTIAFFLENGFACAISDLRGHGDRVSSKDELGYFGDEKEKGFVSDLYEINQYLKNRFKRKPYILIGHSMGSLIARAYVKKYDDTIDALILSGSPSKPLGLSIAKMIIHKSTKKHGEYYRSNLMQKLVMGGFSSKFIKDGSINAWISSDPKVWSDYDADPYCGFIFTLNGFSSLMNLIEDVYSPQGWELKKSTIPILFLSGKEDPCKLSKKKFNRAVTSMNSVGYNNVTSRLFTGMRHEIFNEIHKDEVYETIRVWIQSTLLT